MPLSLLRRVSLRLIVVLFVTTSFASLLPIPLQAQETTCGIEWYDTSQIPYVFLENERSEAVCSYIYCAPPLVRAGSRTDGRKWCAVTGSGGRPEPPNYPGINAGAACLAGTERTVTLNRTGNRHQIRRQPDGFTVDGDRYTFTDMQQGIDYQFNGQAHNDGGSSGWSGRTAIVRHDTSSPTTTLDAVGTAGSNNWWRSAVSVSLPAIDSGCLGVAATAYVLDGANTLYTGTPFLVSGEGSHNLSYSSTDGSYNEPLQQAGFQIDTVAPSLSITSGSGPTGSNGWYSSAVTYTVSAADATSGVDRVEYSLDGGAWQAYSTPVTLSDDGVHSFEAWAFDRAGWETLDGAVYQLDRSGPYIAFAFSRPPDRNGWYNDSVLLKVKMVDSTSAIGWMGTKLNGQGWRDNATEHWIGGSMVHSVQASARDLAGNEHYRSVDIPVDMDAPTTAAVWDGSYLTITPADNLSGILGTTVSIDGVTQRWNGERIPFTQNGWHEVSFYSTDNAGNSQGVQTIRFEVGAPPAAAVLIQATADRTRQPVPTGTGSTLTPGSTATSTATRQMPSGYVVPPTATSSAPVARTTSYPTIDIAAIWARNNATSQPAAPTAAATSPDPALDNRPYPPRDTGATTEPTVVVRADAVGNVSPTAMSQETATDQPTSDASGMFMVVGREGNSPADLPAGPSGGSSGSQTSAAESGPSTSNPTSNPAVPLSTAAVGVAAAMAAEIARRRQALADQNAAQATAVATGVAAQQERAAANLQQNLAQQQAASRQVVREVEQSEANRRYWEQIAALEAQAKRELAIFEEAQQVRQISAQLDAMVRDMQQSLQGLGRFVNADDAARMQAAVDGLKQAQSGYRLAPLMAQANTVTGTFSQVQAAADEKHRAYVAYQNDLARQRETAAQRSHQQLQTDERQEQAERSARVKEREAELRAQAQHRQIQIDERAEQATRTAEMRQRIDFLEAIEKRSGFGGENGQWVAAEANRQRQAQEAASARISQQQVSFREAEARAQREYEARLRREENADDYLESLRALREFDKPNGNNQFLSQTTPTQNISRAHHSDWQRQNEADLLTQQLISLERQGQLERAQEADKNYKAKLTEAAYFIDSLADDRTFFISGQEYIHAFGLPTAFLSMSADEILAQTLTVHNQHDMQVNSTIYDFYQTRFREMFGSNRAELLNIFSVIPDLSHTNRVRILQDVNQTIPENWDLIEVEERSRYIRAMIVPLHNALNIRPKFVLAPDLEAGEVVHVDFARLLVRNKGAIGLIVGIGVGLFVAGSAIMTGGLSVAVVGPALIGGAGAGLEAYGHTNTIISVADDCIVDFDNTNEADIYQCADTVGNFTAEMAFDASLAGRLDELGGLLDSIFRRTDDVPSSNSLDDFSSASNSLDEYPSQYSIDEILYNNPCFNSFASYMLVTTTDGFVPIIDIVAGNQVYAYHQTAGSVGVYDVVAQWSHLDEQVTFVTIDGELIETTPWHDFYTDEGWQDAGELVTGDLVLSLDGDYGVVDSVITIDAIQRMYDLTVADAHTFAVGTGQWVVHNDCIRIDYSEMQTRYSQRNIQAAQRIAEDTISDAKNGTIHTTPQTHGVERHEFSELRMAEVIANPDGVYIVEGSGGAVIFHQGGDIVVVDGLSRRSGFKNVRTAYGPSGILGDSGVSAWNSIYPDLVLESSDPGLPITEAMILEGSIPMSSGDATNAFFARATKILDGSDGN